MLLALMLLACDDEVASPATLEWLAPADGDTVPAGDVAGTVVVEGFALEDPAKHNEGTPEGYVAVGVDGDEVLQAGGTQFTLTLTAGAHELSAQLFYADGDEVLSSDTAICEEDSADTACAPVMATIAVTAE